MDTSADSAAILGADGPFAQRLPGFRVRVSQQAMAARIERALIDDDILIAESGTGTGKTFAYLVPALLSRKKLLISTGTKTLQDQLFLRDLPWVRDTLGVPVSAAMLKGRSNYLCLHRLEQIEPPARQPREQLAALHAIREWAGRTRSGDIAELDSVPEDSAWWPLATSTSDNCLGGRCPKFDDCLVNRARREALKSDIVVVNHYLFFADLALREEGFGQVLPGVDAVVFDEAHQLPEIATQFFGVSVSTRQLTQLARDVLAAETRERSTIDGLDTAAVKLERALTPLRAHAAAARRPLHELDAAATQTLADIEGDLQLLSDALERAAGAGAELEQCARRASGLLDRWCQIREAAHGAQLAWCEATPHNFSIHLTPLDVAQPFQQYIAQYRKSWIFTSATLAVGASFTHFQERLGLHDADTAKWDSPFDYARQALLYLPPALPLPSAPEYTRAVVECALPVLSASGGRAFLLFTSHKALQQAATLLRERIAYPLLVQGEAPRAELLARFRALGNAVLLGSASFWEGVDVRGEALSCVIIDKLPFAAPDDPLLQARGAALAAEGRNAFVEQQLPEAVIALKQGAGRLIRDSDDRGVLMLCDPRLLSKGYGKVFLASLPPMPRTQKLADVNAFFRVAGASDANLVEA